MFEETLIYSRVRGNKFSVSLTVDHVSVGNADNQYPHFMILDTRNNPVWADAVSPEIAQLPG